MSRRAWSLVVSLSLASACVHAPDRAEGYGTPAPLSEPTVSDVPVHGYKTWVRFEGGERLVGELLAAEPEGEVVIRTKKDGDQARPFAQVERATVQVDRKAGAWMGGVGGLTGVLIPLSAASGWFIVYLAPIAGAAGIVALGIIWAESRVVLRKDKLQYLYQYARWPQGKPEPSVEIGRPIGPDPEPEPAPGELVEVPPAAPVEPMPY